MRDEKGRYHNMKAVAESVPAWARGCEKCKCGIVEAPELTGAVSLYLERLVQAIDGDLHFCTCQAGVRYRVSLLNRFEALKDEAKRDKRMTDAAQRRTHPDVEAARHVIHESCSRTASVPTIHYESESASDTHG